MAFIKTMKGMVQSATEMKVKEATNSSTKSGATGSVMNEISIMTFSPRAFEDVVLVIRKRLMNKKPSQSNSIHILKTLTLVSYLLNNSSSYFIEWIKRNAQLVEPFTTFTLPPQLAKRQEETQHLATTILQLLQDDELLEKRRSEVVEFRSSISTPGRISTDNSHIRRQQLLDEFSTRPNIDKRVVSDRGFSMKSRLTTLIE